jgi:CPA1 family monovalent cation:H+ antiporter
MMDLLTEVLGLLVAVAAVALISRKIPVPSPILLVLAGLVLGLIPGLPRLRLRPDLILLVFLPPLVYPAALFTPWRDFRANLRPILLLAVGLVLFTTLLVGWLAHYFIPEFPLAAGLALGAIVSPPDTIATTAIAQRIRVPARIVTVLSGESLVNDATALVAYRLAITAVITGTLSFGHAAVQLVIIGLGGILVGLVIGFITTWVQKRIDDAPVEITISLLVPFAAYLPAEELGYSGVLAVVVTGLYHGWRLPETTSSRTRLQAGPVWEMLEFLLNGFIFLLLGLQLPEVMHDLGGRSIPTLLWYAAVITLAVILIRIVWVFPATYLPRLLSSRLRERDPYPAWQHVAIVAWTGIRGVVSLAAALAVPYTLKNGAPFPGRDLILFLTFVVILATLVAQGLTLPPLIRWLGIKEDRSGEKEDRQARLKANRAALARLDELARCGSSSPEPIERLRAEYNDRIRQLEAAEAEAGSTPHGLFSTDYDRLSHETLQVERDTILQLRNEHVINDETLRRIQHDIDLAEARLKSPGRVGRVRRKR